MKRSLNVLIMFVLCPGREDPDPLDGSGGNRLQEVHVGLGRVELRHRDVGGDVVWRAAILGHEQPGREFRPDFLFYFEGFQNKIQQFETLRGS